MILEKFYTTEYDEQIIFVNPDMSFGEFKEYVLAQKCEFEKRKEKNIVLFCDDYFDYAVNFFSAIFAQKNIYLLTDKTRLEMLDFEYILPEKPTYKSPSAKIEENLTLRSNNIIINLFTSGSTGIPKNIIKTLKNLEIEAQTTIDEFNLPKNGIICSTTSSAHSFGLAFNFILPFYGNFKINREKIEFPEQFKTCDILISSPSFMEKLAKYDFVFENPPQKIFLAGAKLKSEIYEYFSRFSDVIDIYGSTETGNIAYKRNGDVFTLISGVNIELGENNQIIIKTPFCPFEKMPLNDIVEKISTKNFILKKRTDRIVKIQEKRISLDELENNLKKHPSIEDCYCMLYDEKLCCAIVSDNSDINDFKKHLTNYSEILPKKWRILDEIPKTQNGKTDIAKLKKLFGMKLSLPYIFSRSKNNETYRIQMMFKKNSNFFQGHFEGFPIVPGVVQLYYAKFFAEDVFNIQLPYSDIKKIKFSNIMKPETPVTLKLTRKGDILEFVYKKSPINVDEEGEKTIQKSFENPTNIDAEGEKTTQKSSENLTNIDAEGEKYSSGFFVIETND